MIRRIAGGIALAFGTALVAWGVYQLARPQANGAPWWAPLIPLGIGSLPWLVYFNKPFLAFFDGALSRLAKYKPNISFGKRSE